MKAKEASKNSDFGRQHLGSVLVYGGKILAIGYNSCRTNPIQYQYNKYRNFRKMDVRNNGVIHAEMMVLNKTKDLDINWSKVRIFTYRQNKDGVPVLAKPCKACMRALSDRGIEKIYFTDSNEKGWSKL